MTPYQGRPEGTHHGAAGSPEGWVDPEKGAGPGLSSQYPSSISSPRKPLRSVTAHLSIHSLKKYVLGTYCVPGNEFHA